VIEDGPPHELRGVSGPDLDVAAWLVEGRKRVERDRVEAGEVAVPPVGLDRIEGTIERDVVETVSESLELALKRRVGAPMPIKNGDKRAVVWKAVTIPGNRSEGVVGNDRQLYLDQPRAAAAGPTIAKVTERFESQREPLRGRHDHR
jgi:hypothetical protein